MAEKRESLVPKKWGNEEILMLLEYLAYDEVRTIPAKYQPEAKTAEGGFSNSDPLRERYAHIFAGFSDRDLKTYEANMAKESERTKGTPEIEALPDSVKKAAGEVFMKIDGVTQDGASHEGGTVHSGQHQRAKVKELGRGGPEGVYTNEARHDPHKPAPKLDLAASQLTFSDQVSDKHPEVKRAAVEAEKLYGNKDGNSQEKAKGQDQQKGQDGKDHGKEV